MEFSTTQERLNNLGVPAPIPTGHAAQDPQNMKFSIGYIELITTPWTPLGKGVIIYQDPMTTKGGASAFDFDQAIIGTNNDIFLSVPLSKLVSGTNYTYIRTSATYQNYQIYFNLNNVKVVGNLTNQQGTLASFVGFDTYISTITPYQIPTAVNADKLQGFWLFETMFTGQLGPFNQVTEGQSPANATTVPNPLFASSPIPPGSCVITGEIEGGLIINTTQKNDVVIALSYSINKSFEWIDYNGNGQWDIDAGNPTSTEPVVDMGLRGLISSYILTNPSSNCTKVSMAANHKYQELSCLLLVGNLFLIWNLF